MAAYLDRLMAWDIRDVVRVLTDWPARSEFWPTWRELVDQLPDLTPPKPQIEYQPAARKPGPGWRPFQTKREWDEFAACMAKLRDPSVPMLAREALLRMGEAFEARQLPNAQANGWV